MIRTTQHGSHSGAESSEKAAEGNYNDKTQGIRKIQAGHEPTDPIIDEAVGYSNFKFKNQLALQKRLTI